MDLTLKALCMEILNGDVDGDRFSSLLIETGINIDSYEWDVANKLLEKGEEINALKKMYGHTVQ